jgi:hypothetical protein
MFFFYDGTANLGVAKPHIEKCKSICSEKIDSIWKGRLSFANIYDIMNKVKEMLGPNMLSQFDEISENLVIS